MTAKRIGIMTTGGDCSGLNATIHRLVRGAGLRGWQCLGILDGTDGLSGVAPDVIELDYKNLPIEMTRLAGSMLRNGHPNAENFNAAARRGEHGAYNTRVKNNIAKLGLDALVLIGGNGSMSLAHAYRDVYAGVSLVCIPKTIDRDVPCTDTTLGFSTAVQQLTAYCDQLILTARSHHRWFLVQSMGRDCGALALNAGVAVCADAVILPEIKFTTAGLINHIKKAQRDYGIIIVSEGIKMRGHSGRPADMIARELARAGIETRTAFPEHVQRAGDTTATDRLLATSMADTALNAIENNETYVMVGMQGGKAKTFSLDEFFASGVQVRDPNIPGMQTSNAYVAPDDPLLSVAENLGIYIGETK